MKRFDENDVAKRLGAPTPPPPPDLAARIRAEIPERVEVPPALTRPPGTLPFLRRPLGRRLLALAAILVVGIAANLVARRAMRPAPGPLEVALVVPTPAPGGKAAPARKITPRSDPQSRTPAPAGAAAPAAARAEMGKARQEVAADAVLPTPVQADRAAVPEASPQAAAKAVVAAAEAPEMRDATAGVEGCVGGGALGGVPESAPASLDEVAKVYRVGGPVTAPEIIHRVDPEYPEAARRARVQGAVIIEALIDRDGTVRETRLARNTTHSDACAESALRAVRSWRYRPAQLDGRPVAVYLTVVIGFTPE